ncbi:MAG: hypothetical protein ACLVD8_26305 [Enterocloster sp.]|uniref:hypothetical protein n=1 Tax=Enterocloster sp. TaxID=2719315 RepID=UPI003999491A
MIRGKTVIVIAHRLQSIAGADQIVVLDQGNVAGIGRHDTLRKTCFAYGKLWRAAEEPLPGVSPRGERRRRSMIALMKRILSVSGPYQERIKLAFHLCFFEGHAVQGSHRLDLSWP